MSAAEGTSREEAAVLPEQRHRGSYSLKWHTETQLQMIPVKGANTGSSVDLAAWALAGPCGGQQGPPNKER